MIDRMKHYETLDTKVNKKINEVEHLTNYNSTEPGNYTNFEACTNVFSCLTIKSYNATSFIVSAP